MNSQSERRQIAFSILIAATFSIIIILISVFAFNRMKNAQAVDTQKYLEEVTSQYKNTIVKQIEGDIQTLLALATFIQLSDDFEISEIIDFLVVENEQNDFRRMGYVDENLKGYIVGYEGELHKDVDVSDETFILDAFKGKSVLSETMPDKYSNQFINCYAVPIFKDGKVSAVLTATNTTETFSSIVDQKVFNGSGYAHIIDDKGNFIIRSNHALINEEMLNIFDNGHMGTKNENEILKHLDKNEEYFSGLSFNGNLYWMCYIPLGINNWYIFCLVPQDTVNENFTKLFNMFTVILLLLILLFAALFIFIYHILKNRRQALAKLAYFDPLTGAYNKNRFALEAVQLLSVSTEYALVMIDISNFKFINELFGYAKGDELLTHVIHVLKDHIKDSEIYYRDSADNFGMLLKYDSRQILLERLQKMTSEISCFCLDQGQQYNIICNCGVKIIESYSKEMDLGLYIDRASMAMKVSKGRHENTIIFYNDSLHEQTIKKTMIENRMHFALENHEFVVSLQPKYDLVSKKIVSAEALVRWKPSDRPMIFPDEFIPIFEKNGFITKIDMYVLEVVCQKIASWMKQGLPVVPVSVNQSRVLFFQPDYIDNLQELISKYHIPPSMIMLEITEGITMENIGDIEALIQKIHKTGLSVSMDDFGSGYSSLNILKELSIDELKLDRVFLSDTRMTQRRDTILKNVIQLAKDLSITTVAEGIETKQQENFLISIGCDIGQGYLFSKPVDMDTFESRLGT